MHKKSHFVLHLVAIRSRITTLSIILSLLFGLTLWSLASPVKVNAAPAAPMAADSGFLYVLSDCNGCPNQIFGFKVNETTGELTPVLGSPFATGGKGNAAGTSERLTIDRKNLRLFAINDGPSSDGTRTVSAFSITPATGALTALFTPITLPDVTSNNDAAHWVTIAAQPFGPVSLLVVGDQEANGVAGQLASFKITANSSTVVSGSPFRTDGPLHTDVVNPFSTAFSQDGNFVYTGGGISGKIAGFGVGIAADGELNLNATGTFVTPQQDPSAYATDTDANGSGRLFVTSRASSVLLVFIINSDGTLTPTTFNISGALAGLVTAAQGVVHPNGFYMVSDRKTGEKKVSVQKINKTGMDTTLTAIGTFQSGGSAVNLLALNQAGTLLFAANNATPHTLTTFSVGDTGALTISSPQLASTICPTSGVPCSQGSLNGIAYLPPFKTTVTIDPPDITCGQEGIVVVKVSSAAGTPSGNVFLSVDGSAPPLSQPLVGDTAIFTIPALSLGKHTLDATFPAQGDFPSSVATAALVIKIIQTTTTILEAPAITFGQNGSVTVTVSSAFGTPSGDVKLQVDGVEMTPQTLSGGSTTFIIPAPTAGSHTLVASFSAQGCFDSSSSDPNTLVVNEAPTKIFIKPPTISGLETDVTVTVTSPFITPSGSVLLAMDCTPMAMNCAPILRPLSAAGSITFRIPTPSAGPHWLAATFPEQNGFAASNATRKFVVKKGQHTVTTITPDVILGFPPHAQTAPVTIEVTAGSWPFEPASGNVELKLDNGPVMTKSLSGGSVTFNLVAPAAGLHFLKAKFLGLPEVFEPSRANVLLIIRGVPQPSETRTTIKAPAVAFGQDGIVKINVTSAAGTPLGNVSLTVDGIDLPVRFLFGGLTTFILKHPTAGNHSLVASFTGTFRFASSKAVGILVVKPSVLKP